MDTSLVFSHIYSELFNEINVLKNKNEKYVIYGFGSFGQILNMLLEDNIILIVDKEFDSENMLNKNVCKISEVKNLKFDKILLTPIGREKEIEKFLFLEYEIPKEKIYTFSIPRTPIGTISNSDIKPWEKDVDFLNCFNQIKEFTLVDAIRCYSLWQYIDECNKLDSGSFLEVGVWRGGTGMLIASKMKLLGIKEKLYLCDTFEGVVNATDKDKDYFNTEHNDTSLEIVNSLASNMNVENIEILKGIFPEETANKINDLTFRFCHIDVDVYLSAKNIVEWIWDRLVSGGIIAFDDYGFSTCSGVKNYVDEFSIREDCRYFYNLNGHAIIIKI